MTCNNELWIGGLDAKLAIEQADSLRPMKRPGSKLPTMYGAATLCALLFVTGCGDGESPASPRRPQRTPLVTTTSAVSGEMVHAIELNGTVVPYRLARLASPAEGPVLKLRAREGDAVTAGKPLLTIGRKTGVNALIVALTEELQKEQDNLDRTQRLVQSRALPGEEFDNAKASFEKVKSQLASARESKQDYQIAAPFSGMVSRLLVSEGDFVSPRTVLAEIYDPATLVLQATVNERHAVLLETDMRADITLDAYPERSFTGRITRLYPYLDSRTRTRTIEIVIDEAVDLLPGMFGRIRLVIESFTDALTIPVNALLVTPQGNSVVFVARDGKAFQRKVTVGIEDRGRLQILSGVDLGEQVIVSGNEKLKDGTEIRLIGAHGKKGGENGANPDREKSVQEHSAKR